MKSAKAALCMALLNGNTLNIKNCFHLIGLSNCPREISRMVEAPFGVTVTRIHRKGKSKFGNSVTWVDYKLENTKSNLRGMIRMAQYVHSMQN